MSRMLPIMLIGGLMAGIAVGAIAQDGPATGPADEPAAEKQRPPRGGDRFFARHDANQDGQVTYEELCAPAKRMMETLDTDGDGAITKAELEAGQAARREARAEGDRPERRRGPDAEGRGRRGSGADGEGRGRRGPGGEGGEDQRPERPSPDEIFERLDTDGDGNLSLDEFKAGRQGQGRRGPRR